MNLKFICKAMVAAVLMTGMCAPAYAGSGCGTAEKTKRAATRKTSKKKASSVKKTNTWFEGTVDGVNVKVYLFINYNMTGAVTGYYVMDGAKYSLKGEFVDDSHVKLVEGYDDGIWNLEIGVGGGVSRPHIWMTGTLNGNGNIDLLGNFD